MIPKARVELTIVSPACNWVSFGDLTFFLLALSPTCPSVWASASFLAKLPAEVAAARVGPMVKKAKLNAQETQLHKAAATGDDNVVKAVLSAAGVNDIDVSLASNGWTALHEAAFNNHVGCGELLLEAKGDIEARSNTEAAPLMKAAEGGSVAMVQLLLGHGANVRAKDKFGKDALHRARQTAEECGPTGRGASTGGKRDGVSDAAAVVALLEAALAKSAPAAATPASSAPQLDPDAQRQLNGAMHASIQQARTWAANGKPHPRLKARDEAIAAAVEKALDDGADVNAPV